MNCQGARSRATAQAWEPSGDGDTVPAEQMIPGCQRKALRRSGGLLLRLVGGELIRLLQFSAPLRGEARAGHRRPARCRCPLPTALLRACGGWLPGKRCHLHLLDPVDDLVSSIPRWSCDGRGECPLVYGAERGPGGRDQALTLDGIHQPGLREHGLRRAAEKGWQARGSREGICRGRGSRRCQRLLLGRSGHRGPNARGRRRLLMRWEGALRWRRPRSSRHGSRPRRDLPGGCRGTTMSRFYRFM